MISEFKGPFSHDKLFINISAPDLIGVYYMGVLNSDNSLGTLYVGRALGEGVTIKSRLLDHLNVGEWADVTRWGYRVCSTAQEVESLEKAEIIRLDPKYNKRIG